MIKESKKLFGKFVKTIGECSRAVIDENKAIGLEELITSMYSGHIPRQVMIYLKYFFYLSLEVSSCPVNIP